VLRKDDEKDKRRARAVKREEMIAAARDQKSEFEFGKPYEKTRKHSKFDFGEDLEVIPVEIEIDSFLHSLIENQYWKTLELTRYLLKNGLTSALRRGWIKYLQTQGSLAR
jgi:hypothetical protein